MAVENFSCLVNVSTDSLTEIFWVLDLDDFDFITSGRMVMP